MLLLKFIYSDLRAALSQLGLLLLAVGEARLQIRHLTFQLLPLVLPVLFGLDEGAHLHGQLGCLLLQSLFSLLQV